MQISLEPIDRLRIQIVMDNVSDMLLLDEGVARRPGAGGAPPIATRFTEEGSAPAALRAEHGFSALLEVETAGRTRTLLFDAGVTPDGVTDNLRRLQRDPRDIEAVVLSHGHFDHTLGMEGLVETLGRANLPVYLHPEFWTRRRIAFPGREAFELPTTSRTALEGAGFTVVEQQHPSFLLDGALLITGEVDRTSAFERGFAIHEAWRGNGWQPDPLIRDDQAAIVHVRGKGLVVLTGCGHAGIANIVRYARRLTGVANVYAVIGGFHLGGPLFEPIIPPVVAALQEFGPQVVVPAHCTGWKATHAIAAAFPKAFIQTSVGTTFDLSAGDKPTT